LGDPSIAIDISDESPRILASNSQVSDKLWVL
jgi:hypothetical protein